jgi:hypothetical protein
MQRIMCASSDDSRHPDWGKWNLDARDKRGTGIRGLLMPAHLVSHGCPKVDSGI